MSLEITAFRLSEAIVKEVVSDFKEKYFKLKKTGADCYKAV